MLQFNTIRELQAFVGPKKQQGLHVGFIPTLGALHAGHLSMVRRAKKECDLVVVSIFVNPIQFNNPADLKKYPRTLDKDIRLLVCENCDILFAPEEAEMYPPDEKPALEVDLGTLDQMMEGRFRPGHFKGVAIVVKKLFDIVLPDFAYFGKKDFQQLQVIRHLVKSLSMPVTIIPCDTVREADGLAMSSRNMRLTSAHRALAPQIYETLLWARSVAESMPPAELTRRASAKLEAIPGSKLEYFEIVDPETLQPVQEWRKDRPAVACLAVFMGDVRLIDNMELFS